MSNSISYEHSFADIHTHDTITRISYIVCRPPRRLKPKGSLILLHDFFKTNYQFRYVIDLFAMTGYATFALDLPGKHISAHPQQNSKISIDGLSLDLLNFINLDMVHRPLHLAGIGMGAHLASLFARRYPNHVTSIVTVEPTRSERSEDALKFLSSLSAKIPATVRRNAFNRYLDHPNTSFCAADDLSEYADAFSNSQPLLSMQQAYCSFMTSSFDMNPRPTNSTKLQWTPEEQPEDFAVAVLSTFRTVTQPITHNIKSISRPHHHVQQHLKTPAIISY